MVVLGIVLITLAVVLGLGVSVSSTDSTTLEVFGVGFGVIVTTVFFIGAVAGVAAIIGVWLLKKGMSRGYRRHKEVKELRQQVEASPAPAGTTTSTSAVKMLPAIAMSLPAAPRGCAHTSDRPPERLADKVFT